MSNIHIKFLGTGDAFGSGGRFNTCFLVDTGEQKILIDCGASSTIALKKAGIRTEDIDIILITHLHGDHFGGLPFFLIESKHVAKRQKPLIIAGPEGLKERLPETAHALYRESWNKGFPFEIEMVELVPQEENALPGLTVHPELVEHPSGNPSLGLRVSIGGKTIAYSGDTQWTDTLLPLARNSDLFICECFQYDQPVPYHIHYTLLEEKLPQLKTRRVLLTHMGDDMLAKVDEVELECAYDGMEITL